MNLEQKLNTALKDYKINRGSIINLIGFYSFIAIFFAYVSEYFFHYQPCPLCTYQRIVFFCIVGLTFIANINKEGSIQKKLQKKYLLLILVALIINAGIAFFHSGVELKIFSLPESCGSQAITSNNPEELLQKINNTNASDCSKPSFYFLGLTMANWNFIYCLLLLSASIFLIKITKHKEETSPNAVSNS
jgi:disulfide bond formation protein DsbB